MPLIQFGSKMKSPYLEQWRPEPGTLTTISFQPRSYRHQVTLGGSLRTLHQRSLPMCGRDLL